MSETSIHSVECSCGAVVEITCVDSVNVERVPHLRDAILERTFHTFRCGACGAALVADRRILYIDLERRQFYGQYPETERTRERACGEQVMTAWHVGLGDQAPVAVAAMFESERFHVRLCFGLEELREKIVGKDAGLDDLALEVYKTELMGAHPEWMNAAVRTLRLDHVEPDGRLAFFLEQATDPPAPLEVGVLADRARHDELVKLGWRKLLEMRPWIASGPHVSLLRLALPGITDRAERHAAGGAPEDT